MEDEVTSKASKKNQKRRTAKKTQAKQETVTTSDTTASELTHEEKPPVPFDPIADIKSKIEQAKAAKDHDLAQKLRQELWVLQDTMHLGRAGPGAPPVDVASIMSPQKPRLQVPEGVSLSAESNDPTEKKLGKLKKKLQQIETLKQRQANGERLEANQLAKIQTESDIQEEIDFLESLIQSKQLR